MGSRLAEEYLAAQYVWVIFFPDDLGDGNCGSDSTEMHKLLNASHFGIIKLKIIN